MKPSYDEEEALVTALEESRQDALYDRISRAMEQFTLQQPAEKEKEFEEKKNDGVQMFELAKRTPLEAVTDNIVSPSTIKKSGHVAEAGRAPPPPEDS